MKITKELCKKLVDSADSVIIITFDKNLNNVSNVIGFGTTELSMLVMLELAKVSVMQQLIVDKAVSTMDAMLEACDVRKH